MTLPLTGSCQCGAATYSVTSDKGNTNTRYSCAGCGNIIYGIGASSPELTKLQAVAEFRAAHNPNG